MSDADCCPSCGEPRRGDHSGGLCARCLTQGALAVSDAATGPEGFGTGRGDGELTVSLEPASPGTLALLGEVLGGLPRILLHDTDFETEPRPIAEPSSPEMPEPSERPDKYQFFGEIARGGMGAVLRGRDVDLGRELAVKVLLESHRDKPDLVRRFVEEAQIGGQLQHPGVVPIYELGSFADRRPFFAMKLVKGRTLAELLRMRKTRTGAGLTPLRRI